MITRHITTILRRLSFVSPIITLGLFFVHTNTPAFASTQAPLTTTTVPQSISLTIGDQTEIVNEQEMMDWFTVQTKIDIEAGYQSEIERVDLCPTQATFCDFALSQKTRHSFKSQSFLTPKEDVIQAAITTLNNKVWKPPVDAKFTMIDNKISAFAISQDGTQIDINKSVPIIIHAITDNTSRETKTIILPLITIKPDVAESDADKFGITQLIGEGSTNFAGSPQNRIHNFKRAIEQFNGLLIAPKQEFSFVEFLGPVDAEHDYLPELVIKDNKTEPEFGGGICQVSTTVFRAAIYSGLKITARRNHAYAVGYYRPYGMDATIYIPKPDLRFINNTPGYILIQATIEGSKLTFQFYGTSDGRKTEVDGPHILEHNPDGSMKTIFTQKVTDVNGNTFINDDFKSNYKSPSLFPHPAPDTPKP
jgi:vancomycin resistance protein YoaR